MPPNYKCMLWKRCHLYYEATEPLMLLVGLHLKLHFKIYLPYYPGIPFLGMCPKEMKVFVPQNTCTVIVTAALFTIVNIHNIHWKQSKC